jgi:LPS-assembly protein
MRSKARGTRAKPGIRPLALALLVCAPAGAQNLQNPAAPAADVPDPAAPTTEEQVTFSAAQLDYDDTGDIVTATGDVRMLRQGSRLRADTVVWNRKTDEMVATGHVAVVNPGGDTSYADRLALTDDQKNGVADNLLLVLNNGGRIAAEHGTKTGQRTRFDHAAYTPCRVEDDNGCPTHPSWQITALRVTLDQGKHRVYYKDARFRLFGVTLMALPALSHPDGTGAGGGGSGLLLPTSQYSKATGFEFDQPYYLQLGPNRDLTITPRIYSAVLPAIDLTYRQLNQLGAFQIRGMATYGSRLPADIFAAPTSRDQGVRAFIDANGQWQFGSNWTLSAQVRAETDRTFLKRYGINNDDRLRSTVDLERIDDDSYLSIAGWFVQELRANYSQNGTVVSNYPQGQQPIALPEIDYRRRVTDPWLGGVFQLQVNTLALTRTAGQDTQRAFTELRWDLAKLTPWGQQVTFTAYSRADAYHTSDTSATDTALYRGTAGWQGRGIAAAVVDVRWPFVGELFGGAQQITPRVQLVAEPHTKNLSIPDEDSRAVDLEDSNLFALNRFSGYDRWEDSSRVTYGAEWSYTRPRLEANANIGQSYRLSDEPTILPSGTGLSDRFSDYVGRVSVKYGGFLEVTERFRLDKDSLALRRNEVDATVGSKTTYALVGFLSLNRHIDPAIEDLRDLSELRLSGRIQIARYWSIFGSTIIDLTTQKQDPTSLSDGFAPVRDRVGITYENECLAIGVTWLRNYDPTGDARRGSTFSLRLALKNLGR